MPKERSVKELLEKPYNPQWLIDVGIGDTGKSAPITSLGKPKVSKLKVKVKKKPLGTKKKPVSTNPNEQKQLRELEKQGY